MFEYNNLVRLFRYTILLTLIATLGLIACLILNLRQQYKHTEEEMEATENKLNGKECNSSGSPESASYMEREISEIEVPE